MGIYALGSLSLSLRHLIKKWEEICLLAITTMSTISQFNFAKLWPLGVPEENFVNMFWKTGIFLFERSSKTHKAGEMQDATIRLIAVTARKFPGMRTAIVAGLSFGMLVSAGGWILNSGEISVGQFDTVSQLIASSVSFVASAMKVLRTFRASSTLCSVPSHNSRISSEAS